MLELSSPLEAEIRKELAAAETGVLESDVVLSAEHRGEILLVNVACSESIPGYEPLARNPSIIQISIPYTDSMKAILSPVAA
ncbi:hypothetical protein HZA45_01870 [Candidatus Peregrinibacteria bacterium]|nr:hypothetical protein [Candidatus Peregrinibacteria bacterium]